MAIDVTRKGYIEVWKNGEYVSRHVSEWEAIESISKHGDGDFEIRFPLIMARVVGSIADATTGDTQAPTQPGNFSGSPTSATTASLSWDASTDNIGVVGYQIFRDGVPLDTTADTFYNDSGLTPGISYSYTVTAYDAAGNNSSAAGPVSVLTDSNSAPVWNLPSVGFTYAPNDAVNINLDTYCSDVDADPITYALVSGSLPTGTAFSGARNQLITGTLLETSPSSITLSASDGIAAAVEGSFDIYAAWNVFPLAKPRSIFDNDTGITNASAIWRVTEESPLDGSFTYADGGGFIYTPGVETGTASFVYEIVDYDGLGTVSSPATVTITIT